VRAESVVALAFEPSVDVVVAILAVLKAGGVYLPLDGTLPPERLAFMLADSSAVLVLGGEAVLDELPAGRIPSLALDSPATAARLDSFPADAPADVPTPDAHQGAYLIYTSGSTGLPKGVLVTHGNLAAYLGSVPGRLGWGRSGGRYGLMQPLVTDFGNTVLLAAFCTWPRRTRPATPRPPPPGWRSPGSST